MSSKTPTVSVIIPVKNAAATIEAVLSGLILQRSVELKEIIVVDSGSTDQTKAICRKFQAKILNVKKFNHAAVRNLGAAHAGGDFLVFLNQDAIPADAKMLSGLISPFNQANVAAVYGRQQAGPGADPLWQFKLSQFYPASGFTKSVGDARKWGARLYHFSTVCCALPRKIFKNNNFPVCPIYEDQRLAKQLLEQGYQIVYNPQAIVFHEHTVGILASFKRYFLLGRMFKQEAFFKAEKTHGQLNADGLAYVLDELKYCLRKQPLLIFKALLVDLAKFCGFWLGKII